MNSRTLMTAHYTKIETHPVRVFFSTVCLWNEICVLKSDEMLTQNKNGLPAHLGFNFFKRDFKSSKRIFCVTWAGLNLGIFVVVDSGNGNWQGAVGSCTGTVSCFDHTKRENMETKLHTLAHNNDFRFQFVANIKWDIQSMPKLKWLLNLCIDCNVDSYFVFELL